LSLQVLFSPQSFCPNSPALDLLGKRLMMPLRVLILDPSPFFRIGISESLEQGGFGKPEEAQSVEQALELAATLPPDLILVGGTLSEDSSLAMCRQLRSRFPTLKIILITEHSADLLFQVDAAASGVDALLRRRVTHAECWAVIEQVIAGRLMFSREVLAASVQPLKLSDRERAIVKLWAENKTDKEIAAELVMSPHTARTHARNILRKLQVNRRGDAVRRA
jgi:DNA-binding NarL/FixJ family response regulator